MIDVPVLAAGQIHVWRCPHAPRAHSEPTLRQLLAGYLEVDPDAPDLLTRNPYGRPELAAPDPALRFSASHSGDWLLLAFARDCQPGIDIEQLRPLPNALKLAERFFDRDEARALAALPDGRRQQRFHVGWTAREAVLKALGRGLAFGLDRLAFAFDDDDTARLIRLAGDDPQAWQVEAIAAPAGYRATLAWRGAPAEIVVVPFAGG